MKKTMIVAATLISMMALYGCPEKEKGPLERAGESIDEAVNDAGREIEDATD